MKKPKHKIRNKIVVEVISTPKDHVVWYNVGETYVVGNYIVFDFAMDNKKPHFECSPGFYGIAVEDCKIIHTKSKKR